MGKEGTVTTLNSDNSEDEPSDCNKTFSGGEDDELEGEEGDGGAPPSDE